MPQRSRELLEEYVLEIICRAQSIQEKCNQLLSADFASQAPSMLATTLCRICAFLENAIKMEMELVAKAWEPLGGVKVKIAAGRLQIIDNIVRQLGAHVQYVDMARTPSVPWSVIRPFERFARRLIDGITIMLIPQWEYNYSIVTADLYQVYRNQLENLFVTGESLDDVFQEFKKPFHLVFFPALERKNILLHCLLSHELGHLLAQQYVARKQVDFLRNNRDEIINYFEKQLSSVEPLFRQEFINLGIQKVLQLWKRGLEETLSDVVGAVLFGPAMLLSAVEMGIQGEMDLKPSDKNQCYPPWRFRIRQIFKVMNEVKEPFFPIAKELFGDRISLALNKRIELIKKIVESTEDTKVLSDNDDIQIAYRQVAKDIEEAKKTFLGTCCEPDLPVTAPLLYRRLKELITRLDNGIPPNAYEESIDNREPASIVDIINAAWFHKIAWEDSSFEGSGKFNAHITERRETMNLLTLKAIEYSDLETEYRIKFQK